MVSNFTLKCIIVTKVNVSRNNMYGQYMCLHLNFILMKTVNIVLIGPKGTPVHKQYFKPLVVTQTFSISTIKRKLCHSYLLSSS